MEAQATNRVTEPVITLDYVQEEANGIAYVSGDMLTINWQSEGDVAEYRVELLDSENNVLDSRAVATPSLSAYTSALDPTEVYTLNITAIPAGGTEAEGASASVSFALYVGASEDAQPSVEDYREPEEEQQASGDDYQEPEEEEQMPEDDYQEPEVEEQTPEDDYQEPEEEEQTPEDDYQEPEEEEQASEDQSQGHQEVNQEPEEDYQEPEDDWQNPEMEYYGLGDEYQEPGEGDQEQVESDQEPEEEHQEPEDNWQEPEMEFQGLDEEYQEPEADLPTVEDDLEAPEVEFEAPEDDEQALEEWPDSEGEYEDTEDEYQDAEDEDLDSSGVEGITLNETDITSLQSRLVSLGWLAADTFTPGMLDEATVAAISAFQSYCNEAFALNLPAIDILNPVVDSDTMNALQYADETYANPNA